VKTTQDTLDVRGDLIADLLTPEERRWAENNEGRADDCGRAVRLLLRLCREHAALLACEQLLRRPTSDSLMRDRAEVVLAAVDKARKEEAT